MPRAVTTTDEFLQEISGKLDKIVDLLGASGKELAAEPEPDPEPGVAPDEKPAPKKAPAKKTAARKRVTGQ
jgi:hypothetical protein